MDTSFSHVTRFQTFHKAIVIYENYKLDFESVTQYFHNSFLLASSNKACARHQATLWESMIFSSLLKAQNLDSSKGFVNISASFSVLTWWIAISPLASWSLKKWCWMSMCFVQEWFTGLFANLMALSLSHKRGILVSSQPKSLRVCFIQSSWA